LFNRDTSLFDILSNEHLENLLNGLNWEWSDAGNKGIESVSLEELHSKSYLLTFSIVQLFSLNKNFQIGDYYYKVNGHSLSRTSPKIRKPDQNKVAYTIRRIIK
jgi:hypothetical protein